MHVIGPELGLTQPGMTIACGDSHTSTHGAFGALAFGIGTSQVRDVLASQSLAMSPLKVRRIEVNGRLAPRVYAKDVILTIIGRLGVKGGTGFAYEYAGDAIDRMSMDERMTICNMSIEGGARAGYVNPDETTFEYLRGRRFAPQGDAFDRAAAWWREPGVRSRRVVGRRRADRRRRDRADRHLGHQSRPIRSGRRAAARPGVGRRAGSRGHAGSARVHGLRARAAAWPARGSTSRSSGRARMRGCPICARPRGSSPAIGWRPHVRALVVPGSQAVRAAAEREGLHDVFRGAGFEWRDAGCSMCLGMNPDKLEGREVCASSSNRNFKGRQGSPTGRTLLMSPAMVAAAAVAGEVVDVRTWSHAHD